MAVCILNKNLEKSAVCGYSLPQIVDIYLANYSDVTATTVAAPEDGAGVEVATITMKEASKWYHIEPNKNSAGWSDNLQVGGSNNKYKAHSVNFAYSSAYSAGLVDTVDALALGRYLAVLKMADGTYIMLGRNVGLEASESDNITNVGSGDAGAEMGLSVTLTANTTESALPLAQAAVETVLGAQA